VHWLVPDLCLALAAITFAVFGQTLHHQFIDFDDNEYVYDNPMVSQGLTSKGIVWAFSRFHSSNWHALTWLSHMLDCQLYGLNPGGHHLTNVLLHTATVIVLFLVLQQMTGAIWRSAFVAAVFAIHPLRVESVAWVAERKDVLSGLFFVLAIGAYVRYVRHPGSWGSYGLVMLLFVLGLLSKPMLVTLPLILLLLDYWPLRRLESRKLSGLVMEKLPLFAISAAACAVTLLAQHKAIHSNAALPPLMRCLNAVMACMIYLRQMFWPVGLSVFYPYPRDGLSLWELITAGTLVVGLSAAVVWWRRKRPWILMGWLWYLVMLLPVLGIVQVGAQAHADRYTYLPQIGIYMALTWVVAEWGAKGQTNRLVFGGLMASVIAVLMFCAWKQTAYWKDSETLWYHALACTTRNDMAHLNLGHALLQEGKVDEAIAHYQIALEISPGYPEAHNDLGSALRKTGKVDEAIAHFEQALQTRPDFAEAHNNLGNALGQEGKADEAIAQYQQALQIKPDFAEAHHDLGNELTKTGRVDDAITQYEQAVEIKPDFATAHYNLGNLLAQKGRTAEAITHFQKALQIEPDNPSIQNNLAWLLATSAEASLRNGNRAVELAEQANTRTGGKNPLILHTLAAAFAETGRFGDARESIQKAIGVAQAAGQKDGVKQLDAELKRYEAGLPLHQ